MSSYQCSTKATQTPRLVIEAVKIIELMSYLNIEDFHLN